MKYNNVKEFHTALKGGVLMKVKTVLKTIREFRKETISSMASKLEIGVSRYYMIESGERPATPKIAKQIAEILNIKQDDIFLPQSFTARESSRSKSTL